jgi:peptide/nickel transport system substrate-binding protein
MADTYGGVGFYLNPEVYPFNNPLVRQALYYAINTSELAEAYAPDYVPGPTNFAGIPSGFLQEFEKIIPSSFFQHLNNYSYNPQKATQLLEEAGLKEINGQWYLPNGSPFTINIIAPSGYTDWVALSQEFATQLKAFGINAQVFELSTSDFYSEFFSGQFEVAPFFTPFTDTIDAWRIASIIPQPPFNLSKPTWYIYDEMNFTINVTQIVVQMHTLQYGSPQYINDTEKLMAWYNYWLPAIADVEKIQPVAHMRLTGTQY